MYHNIFLTIYLFGGGRGGGRESFMQTPFHHRLKRAWSLTVGLHPTTLAKTRVRCSTDRVTQAPPQDFLIVIQEWVLFIKTPSDKI